MAVDSSLRIFCGPPGVGKTYAAVREAVRLIDGSLPVKDRRSKTIDQDQVNQRYRELIKARRIWFVTFHPTYSYEDFIEGFRPEESKAGNVRYALQEGPFKQACHACRGSDRRQLRAGDRLTEGTGSWIVEEVTPETITVRASKRRASSARKIIPWRFIDSLLAAIASGGITLKDLNIPKGAKIAGDHRTRVAKVTDINEFYLADQGILRALVKHQLRARIYAGQKLGDYTVTNVTNEGVVLRSDSARKDSVASGWEQFVPFWLIDRLTARGISPQKLSISGQNHAKKKALANAAGISVSYVGVTSPLRAVWEASGAKRQNVPTVILIDEINRADLSRVFGELITLLEPDKREGMPEATSIFLPYSKSLFSVPRELSVIGTMNTTDRSLSVIDYALRRRFEFVEVPPNPQLCPNDYGGIDVHALLRVVNQRIEFLHSRDYRVGHAEFMEHKLEAIRKERFATLKDGKVRAFAWILRHKLLPLLLEYFPDWRRAHAVLSNSRLLRRIDAGSEFAELVAPIVDLTGQSSYVIPEEWNPESMDWDQAKFVTCLSEIARDAVLRTKLTIESANGPSAAVSASET